MTPTELDALKARVDAEGLCAQTDPEAFFPELGGSYLPAKAVCRRCTVRPDCLMWALETGERHGIWGGVSDRERLRLRSKNTTTTSERKAA